MIARLFITVPEKYKEIRYFQCTNSLGRSHNSNFHPFSWHIASMSFGIYSYMPLYNIPPFLPHTQRTCMWKICWRHPVVITMILSRSFWIFWIEPTDAWRSLHVIAFALYFIPPFLPTPNVHACEKFVGTSRICLLILCIHMSKQSCRLTMILPSTSLIFHQCQGSPAIRIGGCAIPRESYLSLLYPYARSRTVYLQPLLSMLVIILHSLSLDPSLSRDLFLCHLTSLPFDLSPVWPLCD